MPQKRYAGYLVGALVVLMGLYIIVAYNGLVQKDTKVEQMWSEVQSVYQRRMDLIPGLVNVVKGVSDFEQTTLTQVTEARSMALSQQESAALTADNYNKQAKLQDDLTASTGRLIIAVEKYPQLKGTAAYSALQTQLEGTERRIKVARNDFNEAVANYNGAVRSFPRNLVAALLGFPPRDGFTAVEGADKNVEIKF